MSASAIDRATRQAYSETEYRVHGPTPLTLKIGEANAGLALLHNAHQVDASAFITAWNPFSQATMASQNEARQAELVGELSQRGESFIAGVGQHPCNQWPGEPSCLVLGLSLAAAKALGARFEQNAIVWCGRDAVPRWVLLR